MTELLLVPVAQTEHRWRGTIEGIVLGGANTATMITLRWAGDDAVPEASCVRGIVVHVSRKSTSVEWSITQ